ncbi:uncharacterized protein LOC124201114 [Daphnia pulex]|uniref:uncharacterized protein LOC124201114 n=1 Tax=Daphnia pulex TaxID=6669 RepID=UPI001EE0BF18|nr:uncharacterized protein LOC124201114 [Daphnia pulex]
MGFVTVVIQLPLFLVFLVINCQNTTGVEQQYEHPLDTALFLTKFDTQCISYHYVPCRKNMETSTVIYQDEEMDDPNLSESDDTIKYDLQCISYKVIPCREGSQKVMHKVVEKQQERPRQTRAIHSKRLIKSEKDKNYELSVQATESYLVILASRLTECEISQLISIEKLKMCNEKEQLLTQQLNKTENEKFEYTKSNNKNIDLENKIKSLSEENKSLEETLNANKAIENLQQLAYAIQQEKETAKNKQDNCESQNNELTAQVGLIKKDLIESVSSFKIKIGEQEEEIILLKDIIANLQQLEHTIQLEKESLQIKRVVCENENKDLSAQIGLIEKDLNESKSSSKIKIDKLEQQIISLNKKIEQLALANQKEKEINQ